MSNEKKSGVEFISSERQEQIEKHGRTLEHDFAVNALGQMGFAAVALCSEYDVTGRPRGDEPARIAHFERWCPPGWDKNIWMKMIKKPYKDRLIIAGALIAAEIDRLNSAPPIKL